MTNPTTPHFGLTYLTAGQLQPEVTLNGNMVLVDALTQPSTISITTTTPPSSPADGATYIIPTGATGAWASAAVGSLTVWSANNGAWSFYAPQTGWTVYNQSNNTFYAYNGTAWAATAGSSGSIAALTGDVTASGTGSVAATIAAHAVTNAKAAQMAANTLKGNNTGSTANAADLTVAQVSTLLGLGSAALQPSSAFDAAGAAAAVTASLAPGAIGTVQTLGNANATIANGTATAIITTALTAARTYTLPAASSYAAGFRMLLADLTGSLTGVITATIAPNGTDTIDGGSSYVVSAAYALSCLVTDGVGKWTARGAREGIAVVNPSVSSTNGYIPVFSGAGGLTLAPATATPTVNSNGAITATLGSELVVDANWALGTGWTGLGSGQYQIPVATASPGSLAQNITVTSGATYLLTYTLTLSVANNSAIQGSIGAASAAAMSYYTTSALVIQQIITAGASGSLSLAYALSGAVTSGTLTLSALSCKQITAFAPQFQISNSAGALFPAVLSGSNAIRGGGGLFLTTGSSNTASGVNAQYSITTGSNNTASGYQAQRSLTTGTSNTASGLNAQRSLTTGNNNTASGYQAQYSITTGSSNTASGVNAQYSITTGTSNTASGLNAQYSITTGSNNTASGYQAQYSITTGSNNTASGYQAQYSITTGISNTASGVNAQRYTNAGGNLTTVANSVCIGYDSRQSADGDTNEIVIGYMARGNGSNTATVGNSSTTDTYLSGRVRAGTVVTPATYLVAALPTSGTPAGSGAYASNGRKAGEGAGAGTGIPTWFDGTNWRTYYDNTVTAA